MMVMVVLMFNVHVHIQDIEGKKDDEGGDDGGDDDGKGRMMLLWVLMCNVDDVDEG